MIPHNRPTLGQEEKQAINRVINSKYLSQFKEVKKFEEEFANYVGLTKENSVAVSNGTSAIYIALKILNSRYKEIIFPAYSCSSLMHAARLSGSKVLLCDNKKNSHNMDVNFKEKNKIIIYPQMFGYPSVLNKNFKSNLIEDACQSLGAEVNGKAVGLQGKVGIFSFYATKLITTAGQGGMMISKDKSLIREIKDFINFDNRKHYKFRFNFQMTDVQAAFGREQLKKIKKFINRRKEIFNFYKNLDLNMIDTNEKNIKSVPYRSIIKCKNPKKVIKLLKQNKIEAINPLDTYELLGKPKRFPNALRMTKQTVSLPCYPSLKNNELNYIGKVLRKIRDHI